jgi:polysaccharide biosynthesis/export protein
MLVACLVVTALLASQNGLVSAAHPNPKPPPEDIPQKASDKPVAGSATEVVPADEEYKIGIEDVLLVSVWRDTDLTREVPVRPDGKISLPLIHDIAAAGKTATELGQEIQTRLKDYMSNPSVTVTVREINSLKIYLLGEVVHPGPVAPKSQVRLLQAIAMAGGITPFGGKKKIVIFRKTPSGERVFEVSYQNIISGKKPNDNMMLEPGDTVVVR